MQRLIAGAGLLTLVLTACGNRVPDGPVPHIVAVEVPTTAAPQPVLAAAPTPTPPPAQELALGRANRGGQRIRLAAATGPVPADVWSRLARCESGGNPRAVGGKGKFFGAFQFTLRTWHSLGMEGNPVDYPYADQLAAAQRLQARSGWRNWPTCARRVLHA
jgi:hypothetical protein